MIEVGKLRQKTVTEENHALYKKLKKILNDDDYLLSAHIGWVGVSEVTDYIEKTYINRIKELEDILLEMADELGREPSNYAYNDELRDKASKALAVSDD